MVTLGSMSKVVFICSFIGLVIAEDIVPPTRDCSNEKSFCYGGLNIDAKGMIASCSVPGTFALTFDDGPSPYTSDLLDVVDEYGWKITLFAIGKKIRRGTGKAVLTRAFKSKHQIGSHTFTHPRISNLSVDALRREMLLTEQAIMSVTGNLKPRYMRYPRGEANPEANALVKSMGYVDPVGWIISTGDTLPSTTLDAIGEYKRYLGGDNMTNIDFKRLSVISVQHDTIKNTVQRFRKLAEWLQINFASKGVRFVTLAECLNDTEPYVIGSVENSSVISQPDLLIVFMILLMLWSYFMF